MNDSKPLNLLFLCTGNSCRSQMAEGFARALGGGGVMVRSAGIEAHGKNPRAIAAMEELGIDISSQESTQLTPAMLDEVDVIVTVCGDADERCPALPPGTRRVHWPLPDPARVQGSEEEITDFFRRVRDEIRRRVSALLEAERRGHTP